MTRNRTKIKNKLKKVKSPLEEIIREGARKLLQSAIEREIADYMESINGTGGRRNVVRNGFAPERSILTGIGPISVKVHLGTPFAFSYSFFYQIWTSNDCCRLY